jgi:hypothetical protein
VGAEGARLIFQPNLSGKRTEADQKLTTAFFVCLYSFFRSHRKFDGFLFLQKKKKEKRKRKRKWKNFRNSYLM